MLQPGQKFVNPATGECVEIIETSRKTGGKHISFRATLPRGKGFEVEHFHEIADEIFTVESGWLSYKLDGQTGKIGPGETITLPRNRPHAHWNADAETLIVVETITPGHDTDGFLETLFSLAAAGKLDKNGQPPFLQIMVWLTDLKSKTYLAALPKWVQQTLATVLSPVARGLGYRAVYAP
ncbi:MAG: cupin domain-containing protein [Thermoanaerobaculia bacterium]|nr:cupin domain-containing protein [Thermoanaerobaculia bacterium]